MLQKLLQYLKPKFIPHYVLNSSGQWGLRLRENKIIWLADSKFIECHYDPYPGYKSIAPPPNIELKFEEYMSKNL